MAHDAGPGDRATWSRHVREAWDALYEHDPEPGDEPGDGEDDGSAE